MRWHAPPHEFHFTNLTPTIDKEPDKEQLLITKFENKKSGTGVTAPHISYYINQSTSSRIAI